MLPQKGLHYAGGKGGRLVALFDNWQKLGPIASKHHSCITKEVGIQLLFPADSGPLELIDGPHNRLIRHLVSHRNLIKDD